MKVESVCAQTFNQYFTNQTLRIDYIFSGNAQQQEISVDKISKSPGWYGRRVRLSALPLEGNGQITVRDSKTRTIIYRHSFSTLFQEWLTTPEASTTRKAFENVFLIPMPKDSIEVTINLNNTHRTTIAQLTHTIAPNDILIRQIGSRHVTPYITLQQAADSNKCIRIAFLAEGYTKNEMPIFLNDVKAATQAIFAHEPFKSMQSKFNVVAVKAISEESGTSKPSKGIWKNTILQSNFDTFYSERYLTTLHLQAIHDQLAGIPYEHIIILVNTNQYGGGGIYNSYNLSMTHHQSFKPVVVHEFGHSFAGLADEYAYETEEIPLYPLDIEPWEQNITTKVNFENKWKSLMKTHQSVGLIEGAGYALKGIYRSENDCRMRTNDTPEFCLVCQKSIQAVIDFYTK